MESTTNTTPRTPLGYEAMVLGQAQCLLTLTRSVRPDPDPVVADTRWVVYAGWLVRMLAVRVSRFRRAECPFCRWWDDESRRNAWPELPPRSGQ